MHLCVCVSTTNVSDIMSSPGAKRATVGLQGFCSTQRCQTAQRCWQDKNTRGAQKRSSVLIDILPKISPVWPFSISLPSWSHCLPHQSEGGRQWLQPFIKRCRRSFISAARLMTSSMSSGITSPPSSAPPFLHPPFTPPA